MRKTKPIAILIFLSLVTGFTAGCNIDRQKINQYNPFYNSPESTDEFGLDNGEPMDDTEEIIEEDYSEDAESYDQSDTNLPSNFPSYSSEAVGESSFVTTDSIAQVADYYHTQLDSAGWDVESMAVEQPQGGGLFSVTVTAQRMAESVVIFIRNSPWGSGTMVWISYAK